MVLLTEGGSAISLWEENATRPLATIDNVIAFHLESQIAKGAVTLLPDGDRVVVEIDQLSESCLNPDHPRGRHPAQVFAAAVGLTVAHATELPLALVAAARRV